MLATAECRSFPAIRTLMLTGIIVESALYPTSAGGLPTHWQTAANPSFPGSIASHPWTWPCHQWSSTALGPCTRKVTAADWARVQAFLPTSTPCGQSCHNRRAQTGHIRGMLGVYSAAVQRDVLLGSIRYLLHNATPPKFKKHSQSI